MPTEPPGQAKFTFPKIVSQRRWIKVPTPSAFILILYPPFPLSPSGEFSSLFSTAVEWAYRQWLLYLCVGYTRPFHPGITGPLSHAAKSLRQPFSLTRLRPSCFDQRRWLTSLPVHLVVALRHVPAGIVAVLIERDWPRPFAAERQTPPLDAGLQPALLLNITNLTSTWLSRHSQPLEIITCKTSKPPPTLYA